MCGRFNLMASEPTIRQHFNVSGLPPYQPRYNIAPGQDILTIRQDEDGGIEAVNRLWGLIPSWSKDRKMARTLINARAETVADKPSFRSAYQKRRCLIASTGWYEWQATETGKQPYHIHQPDNGLFAFAGLWERWHNGEDTVTSCAILTTAANDHMASIHTRMPVIIPPNGYAAWLDSPSHKPDILAFDAEECYRNLLLTPISQRVNNPAHDDDSCLL
ncbi:MAG: SOS response-associated peptidase [Methylobacter sp.]|nr:SOS response-associated peptidase [Methylobacter sp.]